MTRRVLLCHPSVELYGSDRMFYESVAAAVGAGHRVTVVLPPRRGPLTGELAALGAPVVHCPTPVLRKAALRPAGFLALLADCLRAVVPAWRLLRTRRPDVVYVNTVTIPLWTIMARLAGSRVIVHVHEAEEAVPAAVRAALAAPLLAAHRVIVNSRATGRALRRAIRLPARRMRLVRNGIAGPPTAAARPAPGASLRVVLVGRISARKGTDVAVAAIAKVAASRPVTLHIVGSVFPGYEWFEHAVRRQADLLGITDRVRWRPFTADVWRAYAGADIAVVPSRVEPFGNTAVEAQLAGVPVIVSGVQGLPEAVAGGRCGRVVPPGDPDALAGAIVELADDWENTAATAARALAEAPARFSPENYRRRIAALLA